MYVRGTPYIDVCYGLRCPKHAEVGAGYWLLSAISGMKYRLRNTFIQNEHHTEHLPTRRATSLSVPGTCLYGGYDRPITRDHHLNQEGTTHRQNEGHTATARIQVRS